MSVLITGGLNAEEIKHSFEHLSRKQTRNLRMLSETGRRQASMVISSMKHRTSESVITLQSADVGFINLQFEKLKLAELSCSGLAALGFGCSAISYDLLFTEGIYNNRIEQTKIVLHSGGIATVLLLVCVVWRTLRELRWQQAKGIYSQRDSIFTTGKYKMLLFELLLNLLYPIYWLERISFSYENKNPPATIHYTYNSMLTICTLVRLYHLIRLASILSLYRSGRAQRVCQMSGAYAGTWFAIRCFMRNMPFRMLGVCLLSGLLIGGFCLRIFERPMLEYTGQDFSEYGNTMWYILVTMTTVGYGDYYPVTLPGRMFGIVMCFWGVLVVSLFVVVLTNLMNLESAEEKSLLILQRLSFKEDMKSLAAFVLTSALRYRWLVKHHPHKQRLQRIQLGKFRRYTNEFQLLRNQQRNLYNFDSQEDRIEGKVSDMLDETQTLKGEMLVLQNFADRLLEKARTS